MSLSCPSPIPTYHKNNLSAFLLNNYLCIYFFHLQFCINHMPSNMKKKKQEQNKN